jgi:hypothetical protein
LPVGPYFFLKKSRNVGPNQNNIIKINLYSQFSN